MSKTCRADNFCRKWQTGIILFASDSLTVLLRIIKTQKSYKRECHNFELFLVIGGSKI